jgi:hypothetical protein
MSQKQSFSSTLSGKRTGSHTPRWSALLLTLLFSHVLRTALAPNHSVHQLEDKVYARLVLRTIVSAMSRSTAAQTTGTFLLRDEKRCLSTTCYPLGGPCRSMASLSASQSTCEVAPRLDTATLELTPHAFRRRNNASIEQAPSSSADVLQPLEFADVNRLNALDARDTPGTSNGRIYTVQNHMLLVINYATERPHEFAPTRRQSHDVTPTSIISTPGQLRMQSDSATTTRITKIEVVCYWKVKRDNRRPSI